MTSPGYVTPPQINATLLFPLPLDHTFTDYGSQLLEYAFPTTLPATEKKTQAKIK